jgi:hypothetical protein
MVVCMKCGTEAVGKFCHVCGTEMRECCPHCSTVLPKDTSFCPQCGARISTPHISSENSGALKGRTPETEARSQNQREFRSKSFADRPQAT